jgi:hypothetical protein
VGTGQINSKSSRNETSLHLSGQNQWINRKLWLMAAFLLCSLQINAQCPQGNVTFQSQQEVEAFAAQYPNCTSISGDLILTSNVTSLSPLQNIIAIDEDLDIKGTSLTTLDDLQSLNNIGGSLIVANTSGITSFSGLSSLTSIGENLNVQSNGQLTSFSGLSTLTNVTGNLTINSNPNLTDISGLKNLEPNKITNLSINGNTKLAVCNSAFVCNYLQGTGVRGISNNATGCENPNTVIASCNPACELPADVTSSNIISNKAKISWTSTGSAFDLEWGEVGFPQGTGTVQNGVSATNYTITGLTESTSYDVYVRQNCTADQRDWVKHTFSTISVCPTGDILLSSQEEVDDFGAKYPNCTQTEGSLILLNDITNLSPLSKLQSIGTHLGIYETQLTNLNGLSSLTSINGGIEIGSNFELEDISGLKNINSGIINLSILANLKLSVCNIASICNYLQTSGYRVIEENAIGCEDENAVKSACTATLSTSDINKKGVMVYPNPFTDVINLSDINSIESIAVNDISGKLIKTIKPTREVNFTDKAAGIYIINIKFKDGIVKSFKVIKK